MNEQEASKLRQSIIESLNKIIGKDPRKHWLWLNSMNKAFGTKPVTLTKTISGLKKIDNYLASILRS